MLSTFECLIICLAYIIAGRILGYPTYRYIVMDSLIEYVSKIKKLGYSSGESLEKSIRPKWFRNILRIISILIWPILFVFAGILIIYYVIYNSIKAFIGFFTE